MRKFSQEAPAALRSSGTKNCSRYERCRLLRRGWSTREGRCVDWMRQFTEAALMQTLLSHIWCWGRRATHINSGQIIVVVWLRHIAPMSKANNIRKRIREARAVFCRIEFTSMNIRIRRTQDTCALSTLSVLVDRAKEALRLTILAKDSSLICDQQIHELELHRTMNAEEANNYSGKMKETVRMWWIGMI